MHRMKDMLSEIMANEDLVLPETPFTGTMLAS